MRRSFNIGITGIIAYVILVAGLIVFPGMNNINNNLLMFDRYSDLMVEKLKKRIEAANGPVMDRVADAIVEGIGKEWQAMIQKSSTKRELHEKLAKIMSEASQKK